MGNYHYVGHGVEPHPCLLCGEITRFPKICLWCWVKYKDNEIDELIANIDDVGQQDDEQQND